MTRYILAVALAGLFGVARAGDFAEPVIIGVTSTITVTGIAISSSVPTDVVISTNPLYRQVCVQNLDTSNYIACGETVSVSTQPASAFAGVQIAKGAAAVPIAPYCFELVPGKRFYCASGSTSASTNAVIIRKR